ncbi:unnamed protein product [Closterium sp. NIES-53]
MWLHPFASGFKCVKGPEEESVGEEERRRFHSLVGSLMYAAVNTRPDVAFATGHCEAEIYAGAMAAQELRWLTYLLTNLGKRPFSPPLLTKRIALCYFLARELQQRRQLCLSYVASSANTADVFTKAFGSGDHHRFCIALGLVPTLPHLLVA